MGQNLYELIAALVMYIHLELKKGVPLKKLKISPNPKNKHIVLKQNRPVRLFNTCSLIILMPEYIKEVQYKFDFNCFVHTPVKRN